MGAREREGWEGWRKGKGRRNGSHEMVQCGDVGLVGCVNWYSSDWVRGGRSMEVR